MILCPQCQQARHAPGLVLPLTLTTFDGPAPGPGGTVIPLVSEEAYTVATPTVAATATASVLTLVCGACKRPVC